MDPADPDDSLLTAWLRTDEAHGIRTATKRSDKLTQPVFGARQMTQWTATTSLRGRRVEYEDVPPRGKVLAEMGRSHLTRRCVLTEEDIRLISTTRSARDVCVCTYTLPCHHVRVHGASCPSDLRRVDQPRSRQVHVWDVVRGGRRLRRRASKKKEGKAPRRKRPRGVKTPWNHHSGVPSFCSGVGRRT